MKRIAVAIQKGGTGKTTLAGNLGYALANMEYRTALVDCDPQGNLTSWLCTEPPKSELADVLSGSVTAESALVQIREDLAILPTFGIDGSLQSLADMALVSKPYIFDDLCKKLERLGFAYVVFDLSPGMSLLEKYVILAADEVITPLTPEFFSLDGIEIFANELQKINRDYRRKVKHTKIVANAVNRSFRRHTAIYDRLAALNYELFTIGQDSRLAESQLYHETIFTYASDSRTIPEIQRLAQALGR